MFQKESRNCVIFFPLIGWEKVQETFIPFTGTQVSLSTNIPGHLLWPLVSWANRKYRRRICCSLNGKGLVWRGENTKSHSHIVWFQICSKNNLNTHKTKMLSIFALTHPIFVTKSTPLGSGGNLTLPNNHFCNLFWLIQPPSSLYLCSTQSFSSKA